MHIVAVLNQDKTFGEVALRTNVPRFNILQRMRNLIDLIS